MNAYIDDYAYTAEAFVALFEATGRARWIGRATRLADSMLANFEDRDAGGFFYTSDDAESLITRNKDWHDGSLVSGNASAAMALLRLSRLCDREDYRAAAERTFLAAGDIMEKQSAACAALLSALDRYWHDHQQIVLAVNDGQAMTAIRPRFLKKLRPHATLSWVIGDAPESGPMVALNQHRGAVYGQPTLYECRDYSCQQPIVGEERIDRWLS